MIPSLTIKVLDFNKTLFCVFFFSFVTGFSQPLDFKRCNTSNSKEVRQHCLESGFELFFNYVTIQNKEKLELKEGEEELVHFKIVVDSLGAFHLKNSYNLNEGFEEMVSSMLQEIEPIGKLRIDNKAVEMSFEFKNLYTIDIYNQIVYKKFNESEYNVISMPSKSVDSPPEHKNCANGDKNYKERCLNLAIQSLLYNQFDIAVFAEAEVSPGFQEITVIFTIDARGEITNIKATASHPLIEKEIIRLISTLPKFIPATKDNKPVAVSFRQKVRYEVTKKMLRRKRRH
tara:strand:+ start:133 stop:993 length:861 start_codon:yes stop_codon:yes gene_type:complete